MLKKLKTFIKKYRQPLFFVLLGIVAGVLPSIFNHLGEFWKWSFLAKTASQYGFWIIFVVLIIIKSKIRKFAMLNVFLFCFVMCIAYGIMETIYKIPLYSAGVLSTDNIFGNNLVGLFFEYEFGQVVWFVVIALLIPISGLIYDYLHKKTKTITKVAVNFLIIAPLAFAAIYILCNLARQVVVCADISRGWTPAICTFQSPDAWIITNLLIEAIIYIAFIVFWLLLPKLRKNKVDLHGELA